MIKKFLEKAWKPLVAILLATGGFFVATLPKTVSTSEQACAREIYTYPYDDPNRLVYVSATSAWSMTFVYGEQSKTFWINGQACSVRGVSSATREQAALAIERICAQGWEEAIAVGCVFFGVLPAIEEWIASEIERAPVNAEVVQGSPIAFAPEREGVAVDRAAMYAAMRSVCNQGGAVRLVTRAIPAERTRAKLAREVTLLSTFSTSIASSTSDRKHNVRLAMSAFAFYRMRPNEVVSFNTVVGARTPERGYRGAKVIMDGEYVDGVGGGVCQASTTIYNALLLSGIKVCSVAQHSLAPSYVAPSRDAMVSMGVADLVWVNPTARDMWLVTVTDGDRVTAQVYGYDDGARYAVRSVVTGTTPPPPAETVTDDGSFTSLFREGEESIVVRAPHPEVCSEAYLDCTRNGVTTSTLIRKNKYKSVRAKVVYKRVEDEAQDAGAN